MFEDDVINGVDGTGIKPGLLKVLLTNCRELDVFRAMARISAETGMPMQVHIQPGIVTREVIDIAKIAINELGMNPEKLMIVHSQYLMIQQVPLTDYIRELKTTFFNLEEIYELLDLGVRFSLEFMGTVGDMDNGRELYGLDHYNTINLLVKLIEKGYAHQIMLGHDFATRANAKQNGAYGLTRVLEFVCPTLEKMGYKEAVELMIMKIQ